MRPAHATDWCHLAAPPPAGGELAARHRLTGSRLDIACVAAPKSALPDPDPPGKPEGSATHSRRVRTRLRHRPILFTLACMQRRIEARVRISSCMPRCRSRTDVMRVLLQSTTTNSRIKLRAGWLRSLFNLFGLGKQQEASSILAAVRAAEPVGHTRADRAVIKRWQTRGSIEHEDLAL